MTITASDHLAAVLAGTRTLLMDFDGPICDIFAGHPAATVAAQLRTVLQRRGAVLTGEIGHTEDPIQVLRLAAERANHAAVTLAADALRTAELTAVATAAPTPGADQVIEAALHTGRQLAVVSNNATDAVTTYLHHHGLTGSFRHIQGRDTDTNPRHLKPSNHLVTRTLAILHAASGSATMLGDAPSDMYAARSIPIACIGYANRAGKATALTQAGADAVVDSMAQLAAALYAIPPTG